MISYEFKIKKYENINKNIKSNIINNSRNSFINKLSKYTFSFQILKKKRKILNLNETYLNTNYNNTFHNICKNKEKMDMKILNRNYKYNFSNKSIGTIPKIKNFSKTKKKPESKKVRDLNLLENENNNFFKEKTQYKNLKINNINITEKEITNSFTQKRHKFFNSNNNATKFKHIFASNNKYSSKYNILHKYRDLSSSQSHSKLIKKKFENSFNNSIKSDKKFMGMLSSREYIQINRKYLNKNDSNKNHALKTLESKKIEDISFEKEICYTSNSRQKHRKIIKKNDTRFKDNKDPFYPKPIINKIIIFNNISNNNINNRKKINLNEKSGKSVISKYKSHNRAENNYNNFTMRI